MNTDTVLTIGLLIVAYTLVSGRLKSSIISPAIVFVTVGLLAGPFVLGIISPRVDQHGFEGLAQLALSILLFLQAARLDLRALFARGRSAAADEIGLARRLIGVGLPVAMGLGTLLALLLLPGLPFWEAAILAIIVAPSEAALARPVISDPRVPGPIRRSLSIESGVSDGLALALLLIAFDFASKETTNVGDWISTLFQSVILSFAVGAVVGLVGGWLLARGRKVGNVTETWAQLYLIALAALTFVIVEHLHGSGFVGAFGAGLGFAFIAPKVVEHEGGTAEAVQELLELVVFALFGAVAVWPAFRDADIRVFLFAVLILVVVRPLAVAIATAGKGLSRASVLFLGWFGPRGLGTLLFGFLVLEEHDLVHAGLITQTAVVVVTLSIFLHGMSAMPGVKLYTQANQEGDPSDPEPPRVVGSEG